ncbi:hypothetical protein ACLOJK_026912 [Asimina triloba]
MGKKACRYRSTLPLHGVCRCRFVDPFPVVETKAVDGEEDVVLPCPKAAADLMRRLPIGKGVDGFTDRLAKTPSILLDTSVLGQIRGRMGILEVALEIWMIGWSIPYDFGRLVIGALSSFF